jgi:hypothetical protein
MRSCAVEGVGWFGFMGGVAGFDWEPEPADVEGAG